MCKSWLLMSVYVCASAVSRGEVIHFDHAKTGSLPPGWTAAMTHKGGPPRWEIVQDSSAPSGPNVLAQLSDDATAGRFPLAIYDNASFANGSVGVRFKTIAGRVDQAAGIVWRYQNPENYYIARANALENNVVLYKVENGQRVALAPRGTPSKTYGVKHAVPRRLWNTLFVEFDADVTTVVFNGEKLFEVVDSTFKQAGKVGLWTKADSVTYFDDLRIEQKIETRRR